MTTTQKMTDTLIRTNRAFSGDTMPMFGDVIVFHKEPHQLRINQIDPPKDPKDKTHAKHWLVNGMFFNRDEINEENRLEIEKRFQNGSFPPIP